MIVPNVCCRESERHKRQTLCDLCLREKKWTKALVFCKNCKPTNLMCENCGQRHRRQAAEKHEMCDDFGKFWSFQKTLKKEYV